LPIECRSNSISIWYLIIFRFPYKWQLDGQPWSAETSITQPIQLANLAPGPHQVAVIGKNDAGLYQNDPALGTNAVVTLSRVWTLQRPQSKSVL
jgi:hypothetical protein